MKTKKYYTSEEIENMPPAELRELVKSQQAQLEALRWSTKETKELIIAALQVLPKTIEL